jgi:flagellin
VSQIINTNLASLNAQRNMAATTSNMATALQRLSSGLRVNSAKDDAAGMAIAERMGAQARGMSVAMRNANDAISLAQTAEGAIGKITDMLQRMRELAVQSANATNTTADRGNLNAEFQELRKELSRTIESSRFNGKAVVGGDAGTQTFQVGELSGDRIDIVTRDLSADTTIQDVTSTASSIDSINTATTAMADLDAALSTANVERANYGAAQNRFEAIISTLQVAVTNNTASRSRIMDADFAAETANMSRAQILQQAGTAMMAQANQAPQQVMSLLRG